MKPAYTQFLTVSAIIVAGALSRLLPHMPNATPIAAMALFSGVYAGNRLLAFIIPLAAMLLSDAMLGFTPYMFPVYLSFAIITAIGLLIRNNPTPLPIATAAITSSILFFLITNCVFLHGADNLYPVTRDGAMEAYAAAIPFFRATLLGDLFYTAVFFGGYAVLRRRFPVLKAQAFAA